MIIESNGSVYTYVKDIVIQTFRKLCKEFRPELGQFKGNLRLSFKGNVDELWRSAFMYTEKSSFSKKDISDVFYRFYQENTGTIMKAIYVYAFNEDENSFKLEKLGICILRENFFRYVLTHFHELEQIKKHIEVCMRHEFGHILDYISWNGKNIDDWLVYREASDKAKQDFYNDQKEVFERYKGDIPVEEEKRLFFKYYEIPVEKTANDLGGVTAQELYDVEPNSYPSKLTLDINVIDVEYESSEEHENNNND